MIVRMALEADTVACARNRMLNLGNVTHAILALLLASLALIWSIDPHLNWAGTLVGTLILGILGPSLFPLVLVGVFSFWDPNAWWIHPLSFFGSLVYFSLFFLPVRALLRPINRRDPNAWRIFLTAQGLLCIVHGLLAWGLAGR